MRVSLTLLLLLTLTRCLGQTLSAVDKKLADVYENVPERYTDDQKEARMELFERLLMKYTRQLPKTIGYPFKNLSETSAVYISTSDDGNLRIYSYDRNRRRSMPWFNNVYQYRVNGKVLARHVKPPHDLVPDYTIYKINTLAAGDKTYYIAQRVAFGGLLTEYSLRFMTIENGGVNDNIKLVQTGKTLENVLICGKVDELNGEQKFSIDYDKASGTISMPVVSDDGKVGSKRVVYKFNGKWFVRV
jgi:hypothetical protein